MAPSDLLTNPYRDTAVVTASPARLVVMLYDRLVVDISKAEAAMERQDPAEANAALTHAQEILIELSASLDRRAWDGAPALAALYDFLLRELVGANIAKDPARVAACGELVVPLRDAWREIAGQ